MSQISRAPTRSSVRTYANTLVDHPPRTTVTTPSSSSSEAHKSVFVAYDGGESIVDYQERHATPPVRHFKPPTEVGHETAPRYSAQEEQSRPLSTIEGLIGQLGHLDVGGVEALVSLLASRLDTPVVSEVERERRLLSTVRTEIKRIHKEMKYQILLHELGLELPQAKSDPADEPKKSWKTYFSSWLHGETKPKEEPTEYPMATGQYKELFKLMKDQDLPSSIEEAILQGYIEAAQLEARAAPGYLMKYRFRD